MQMLICSFEALNILGEQWPLLAEFVFLLMFKVSVPLPIAQKEACQQVSVSE